MNPGEYVISHFYFFYSFRIHSSRTFTFLNFLILASLWSIVLNVLVKLLVWIEEYYLLNMKLQ